MRKPFELVVPPRPSTRPGDETDRGELGCNEIRSWVLDGTLPAGAGGRARVVGAAAAIEGSLAGERGLQCRRARRIRPCGPSWRRAVDTGPMAGRVRPFRLPGRWTPEPGPPSWRALPVRVPWCARCGWDPCTGSWRRRSTASWNTAVCTVPRGFPRGHEERARGGGRELPGARPHHARPGRQRLPRHPGRQGQGHHVERCRPA